MLGWRSVGTGHVTCERRELIVQLQWEVERVLRHFQPAFNQFRLDAVERLLQFLRRLMHGYRVIAIRCALLPGFDLVAHLADLVHALVRR